MPEVTDRVPNHAMWREVWSKRPDALLYPTLDGGPVEQSFSHLPFLAAEGCRFGLIEAGSVNLGPFVYANSAADIDHHLDVCHANGLGVSLAVSEPGFLRTALRRSRRPLQPGLPAGCHESRATSHEASAIIGLPS
jgi:beta-keto acid cleavage enzyme